MTYPSLKFFAGLWTLRNYPGAGREWTLEEKFAEIQRQGFDAVGGRLVPGAPALCAAHGLDYILYLDVDRGDAADQLRQAVAWQPRRINVQLCDHDTPLKEAVRTWIEVDHVARDLGLAVDLEVHRDTATETPEKAFAIADRFALETGRPARLSLDFSHFAVTKHLVAPFAPRLLERRDLVANARQFHLRPFNGHHAQVPATDGRGVLTPEFEDFLAFVQELFALVSGRASPADVVYACPENGPQGVGGYALSCFPDVWQDAIRVRDEALRIWDRLPISRL